MSTAISLNRFPSHERLERLTLLAEWYLEAGSGAQAKACLDQALQMNPQSIRVQTLYAQAEKALHDTTT